MTLPQIFLAPEIPFQEQQQKICTDYNNFKNQTPIVIDYGSNTCRVGWGVEEDPRLVFENVISKFKTRKGTTKNAVLVGNDIYSDPLGYPNSRSAFDNGIVNNFDVVESTMDYIFLVLGIDDNSIDHPIVMTEPLANLYSSRKNMNELLFECYSVPSVAYGVDSLWSYYYNAAKSQLGGDGIIISTGNYFTHIIPVFSNKPQAKHAIRINIGGSSMVEFLLRLIQIKYPSLPVKVNEYQSKILARDHTYFADDYAESLDSILERNRLSNLDHIIQFPFKAVSVNEKSQEELDLQAEKRRENAKNLQKIAVRVRQEKLEKKEIERVELQNVLDEINELGGSNEENVKALLRENGFYSKDELVDEIKKIDTTLKRARDKDLGIDPNENKEPHKFDLVDVPDDQLSTEDLKEKRKQKLLKANIEARDRIRLAKIEEQKKKDEEKRKDDELRKNNLHLWLTQLKNKRQAILDNLELKNNLKNELSNRKSQASQLRMKNIADLASNETPSTGTRRKRQDDSDDNFGEDDSDWNVYLDISKDNLDEDDSPEAELIQINELLFESDPQYLRDLDDKARDEIENRILYRFYSGSQKAILSDTAVPKSANGANGSTAAKFTGTESPLDDNGNQPDTKAEICQNEHNVSNSSSGSNLNANNNEQIDEINELAARSCQVHLNVERIRAPEILFDPSIMGVDQAGIVEAIENIWKNFPGKAVSSAKNIFVTGLGFSKIPGFQTRLERELTSVLPIGSDINVRFGSDVGSDAWRGAALWSRSLPAKSNLGDISQSLQANSITRQQYNECGGEYLQEHLYSNLYFK